MVTDPADDATVLQAARRAYELARQHPSAGDIERAAEWARVWWEIMSADPARAVCERWFNTAFRFTCDRFPGFREERDDFWQEAQVYMTRRLAERVGSGSGLDSGFGPTFALWVRHQLLYSCHNLARREARRARRESAGPASADVPDLRGDDPWGQADVQTDALKDCVSRLPLEQRAVVSLMVEVPNITYRQIAARLGAMSVGTVSSRFHSARDYLRQCLERKGLG